MIVSYVVLGDRLKLSAVEAERLRSFGAEMSVLIR
jgi:hypothetical protein